MILFVSFQRIYKKLTSLTTSTQTLNIVPQMLATAQVLGYKTNPKM